MGEVEETNTDIRIQEKVPLRTGPPTREELITHYPHKFTWEQLKTFVNSGDLGLLKRDKALQLRYNTWSQGIKAEYGSIVNYLINVRLQWGKPDTQSLLQSAVKISSEDTTLHDLVDARRDSDGLPTLPQDTGEYFKADSPPELISIIQNDWPYSVPPNIEHTLVWTRLPIIHASLVPSQIAHRVGQDGLWGFTGSSSPPPSPSLLPSCLPALADWSVTEDKLIRSQKPTEEEATLLRMASQEVDKFVSNRWNEREWETAWFVNPPRLQSVPGLAHVHVFARHKSPDEISKNTF